MVTFDLNCKKKKKKKQIPSDFDVTNTNDRLLVCDNMRNKQIKLHLCEHPTF